MIRPAADTRKLFPLSEVYRLLEPGPVVLVTTSHNGKSNVMTMSWYTMLEFEPPLVACVMSEDNFSFKNLTKSGECVLNIPTAELAKKVVGCGSTSGRKIDKFKKFGLNVMPASRVQAPLLSDCYANLECVVVDKKMVKTYNLFILKVVKASIDPSRKKPHTLHHFGKGLFMVGGRMIKLRLKVK